MTDDEQRPKPGVSPARRARRIGGRPSPAPTPQNEPVRLDKTAEVPAGVLETPSEPPGDAAAAEPAGRPTTGVRSLPLAWFPAAVLGTAAVLLVGILVWFSHGGYWGKPQAHAISNPSTTEQQQVLAAAKTCFATLNSYDYRKLDDAMSAGLKCTTGSFTGDYEAAFNAQVKKYAPAVKIVRVAQVNRAGVESISPDGKQWTVLIYGQLQITSTTTKQKDGSPQISPVGGVVTMDDVHGRWLVAKVDNDAGNGLSG